ncbi:winged helix-turn-helix transcriptional regulator [Demequina sp. SYSU T00192]|uniref:Winged helix-turn-helix transcriptional regulator n=1 Tax=Demequina litoralis TaxID=3051660 RepID=A0ABT8GCW2_9MICO|nr:winged helix-turn-helix transcriptional regulator [Demequina sp. SYSU T00192]MDN4476983.1 winged helix-turn-helix transcriptional regulator [Demequina sp. SYSU T00192]
MHADTTRDRVLSLIATAGPITAAALATELGVTPAGVRRHLSSLEDSGYIVDHEPPGQHARGRGRPARSFVATNEGQRALATAYRDVAVDAMSALRDSGGLHAFVEAKAKELEDAVASSVDPDAPMERKVADLAAALGERGFAASVRPGPGGITVQLCQGHCPVQSIAEKTPEWCEAEARAFSRILDVHVQRLSTLAGGAHVCTTTIPLATPTRKEG